MRNWNGIVAAVAAAFALSAAVYALQKGGGAKALTVDDHAEIQRLYTRYAYALDSHAEGGLVYASTYAADGEFVYGTNRWSGRDRLIAFAKGRDNPRPSFPRHHVSNVQAVPSPEGARGSAYVLVVTPATADKPAGVAAGTYSDVLVKTPQGWRFKRREIVMDVLMPEAIGLLSASN